MIHVSNITPMVAPSNDLRDRLVRWLRVQLSKILVNIYDHTTASNIC